MQPYICYDVYRVFRPLRKRRPFQCYDITTGRNALYTEAEAQGLGEEAVSSEAAFLMPERRRPMTRREIRERVRRCDATTSMANAFRRALGMRAHWDAPPAGAVVSRERYAGMRECFRNDRSALDSRRDPRG